MCKTKFCTETPYDPIPLQLLTLLTPERVVTYRTTSVSLLKSYSNIKLQFELFHIQNYLQ